MHLVPLSSPSPPAQMNFLLRVSTCQDICPASSDFGTFERYKSLRSRYQRGNCNVQQGLGHLVQLLLSRASPFHQARSGYISSFSDS